MLRSHSSPTSPWAGHNSTKLSTAPSMTIYTSTGHYPPLSQSGPHGQAATPAPSSAPPPTPPLAPRTLQDRYPITDPHQPETTRPRSLPAPHPAISALPAKQVQHGGKAARAVGPRTMPCPTKARNLGQRGVSGRARRPMGLNRRQLPRRGPARPGKNDLGRATDRRRTDGQCGGTKIYFSKIHGRGGAVVGNPEGGASGAGAGWGASGGVGGRKMSFAAFFFHLGLQLLVRVSASLMDHRPQRKK